MHTILFPTPPPQNLQYGTHGALKPPKRVWGKSRNVTDNSPTRLGAHRAALSYPKHSGVSWVWLAIAILVKPKCTLRGLMLRFWAIWGRFGPIRVTPRESHGICNRNVYFSTRRAQYSLVVTRWSHNSAPMNMCGRSGYILGSTLRLRYSMDGSNH